MFTLISEGCHFILPIKGNQRSLHQRVKAHTQRHRAHETFYSCDMGQRGRIEQRQMCCWSLDKAQLPLPWQRWFNTLISVTRQRERFDTKTQRWVKNAPQTTYYASDLTLSAAQAHQHIHAHWSIENPHDVALKEDQSRIRVHPERVAVLRSFALNLMRANGISNIRAALYDNALDLQRLLNYRGLLEF